MPSNCWSLFQKESKFLCLKPTRVTLIHVRRWWNVNCDCFEWGKCNWDTSCKLVQLPKFCNWRGFWARVAMQPVTCFFPFLLFHFSWPRPHTEIDPLDSRAMLCKYIFSRFLSEPWGLQRPLVRPFLRSGQRIFRIRSLAGRYEWPICNDYPCIWFQSAF